jgi:type 1 glutamine amidotransferase
MKKLLILSIALVFSLGVMAQGDKKTPEQKKLNVLVFSKTSGFRHTSIPSGIKAITTLAQQKGWIVTATEDPTLFTDDFLVRFDVCVFLNPTANVLDEAQEKAFTAFIRSGKGFVGIHASADCEYDWKWYGELNGAFFKTHPPYQQATINIENTNHPAMKPFLGMKTFTVEDEWYSFKENPRGKVTVLATLDESSIKKLPKDDAWKMGDHPVIWYHEFDGYRSFYTVFGHGDSSFENENIRQHLFYAIEWAGRRINL